MQGTIYHQVQASLNTVLTDTQTHKIGADIPFLMMLYFFYAHRYQFRCSPHSGITLVMTSRSFSYHELSWRKVIFLC